MRHVMYERVQYLRKSTHVQEEEGSIVNEYNVIFLGKQKCNEIEMLPSVRNVTEVVFPSGTGM
jgi:hypothetical protein